jgi:lysophospholipase L1-like esterase
VVLAIGFAAGTSRADEPAPKAGGAESLAGKRIVFLGDSITQGGQYVSIASFFLERQYPRQRFDVYSLGLSSETLSGLSEPNHAGGKFPRPCLFERLGRLLERVKPQVVFACYGINDGIYLPLDPDRFAAFQKGVKRLIADCQAAGVTNIYLVTPPIYDLAAKPGEFNYDAVLTEYAAWEMTLKLPGVHVIDLHTPMRRARDARTEPFSRDRVHPGEDGHLFLAQTILAGLGLQVPDAPLATIKADPLFKLVDEKRRLRSTQWMKHIGYTREITVEPQPLGGVEDDVAKLQQQIEALKK